MFELTITIKATEDFTNKLIYTTPTFEEALSRAVAEIARSNADVLIVSTLTGEVLLHKDNYNQYWISPSVRYVP